MSTANYDATLISWAAQTLQNNVTFDFGSAQYTLGGAAEAARNTLINTYGWTITDGGGIFVGLLDTYPNASAAYSLRYLASASVGSAVVRVRRSSDNTEQDFTATEITDGTLTTFTGANDGFVTTWYDQSGNLKNATQATASNQPKLVSNGVVNLQEGKPSIYYDGADNFEFAQVDTTDSISSVFAIVEQKENNNQNIVVSGKAFGEMQLRLTSDFFAYITSYLSTVTSMPIPNNNQNVLLTSLATLQKVDIGLNGYLIAGDTPPNINENRQKIDAIGFAYGGDTFEGNMQEIIIYNTDQSLNKIGIETNMGNNYNLNIFPVVTGGLLSEYPGASAAYSLRGLLEFSTGYDINVVRVRRSSDNKERNFNATQITDGTLTTFTGINDGFVVTWYDQSDNSNHASQATAAKQAMLVENGVVNLYNGKPSINFERSLAQKYDLSSDINTVNTVSSIFSVVENKNDGFGDKVFVSGGGIGTMQLRVDTTQTRFNYISTQRAEIEFIDITLGQHLLTSFSKQQGVDLAVDGGSLQIGTTPPNLNSQKIDVIGFANNTSYFNGNIQELVIYDTDQSANKTGIETNINTEYDIYEPINSELLADYPGASAAYSLRNLINTTTNVVRVRRSNDNTEQDFTATDITDGTLATFCSGTDGFVAIWYDQSGSSNNATQLTASEQPKLVTNGVVELDNGKPCLRYDTTGNDSFNLTTRLTDARSTFSVVNFVYNSGDLTQYLFGDNSSYDYASGNDTLLSSQYAASYVEGGDNKINNISSDFTTTARPLAQSLVSMIHTSSTGKISRISKDRNLNSRSLQGKLQEIIIYDTDQSANRTGIETNINNEYTIY